ncbi:MAG: nucleotidyl transferase AbiEii/AbiGii toxin family protein [Betaproteobacteria bacterium]|nr:nucleotidyl transferase AbiEii/AbiGii toxin family protein [Betaproteobacteria bacterium]
MAVAGLDLRRPGSWTQLFPSALKLMAQLETKIQHAHWTFGGGTVLMLRIGHRQSKDIDLFVPDPQYLGHVNPRLSEEAEQVSTDYSENAEFIKLFLPTGEIDIVVGTALTEQPFEQVAYAGRAIKLETCGEIIAKKMWHRGYQAKARDLFDLCAVADAEPEAIGAAAPFLGRHGAAFLQRLTDRAALAEAEFKAIDNLGFSRSFADCLSQAHSIIKPILAGTQT